ncbi:SAVED domain-containing protein [Rhodococcus sp. NPDC059968]|uniref:SAVED domain-containing protein n=1 Tax=Rhodococcus sp. NPDC059968 TaxID=3347017 RepID=UPI00366BBFF4
MTKVPDAKLAPRAAALRGDDYQHIIGWWWMCKALREENIESISIEDASGGAYDDIVVRRRNAPHTYWQVKTSTTGSIVVNEQWLTTAPKGENTRSPLQRFYVTWRSLHDENPDSEFSFVTDRAFDHTDKFFEILDLKTHFLNVSKIAAATNRMDLGKQRTRWCSHLGIDVDELYRFLRAVKWENPGGESHFFERASAAMELAGLLDDENAVKLGRDLVREIVTDGLGPQSRDQIKTMISENNLLVTTGTLCLDVHAIDRRDEQPHANLVIDLTDVYDGDEPGERFTLKSGLDWDNDIAPRLRDGARSLDAYRVKRVHVRGSMRLPMWFAVGRVLSDTRNWILSVDNRTERWSTTELHPEATPRILSSERVREGADLAVGIALTHDLTAAVTEWARGVESVGSVLIIGPESGPGPTSVPDGRWATGWARNARDVIVAHRNSGYSGRIHLFFASPQGSALMLGHYWNLMPKPTVYEYIAPAGRYEPTLTI